MSEALNAKAGMETYIKGKYPELATACLKAYGADWMEVVQAAAIDAIVEKLIEDGHGDGLDRLKYAFV